MFPTVVFAVSLVGLLALFGFKTLELQRNVKTPLTPLRRAVDPMLAQVLLYCRNRFRTALSLGLHLSLRWVGALIRQIEVAFYTTVHGIAARLNQYLRTRRLHIRHGSGVSTHLKTVLEKGERPDTSIDKEE